MAKGNKFTAVDPNGFVHKRTSLNRVYTHMVVARVSLEAALKAATSKQAADRHAANFKYYKSKVDGTYDFYRFGSESDEKFEARVAHERAAAAAFMCNAVDADEFVVKKVADDLDRIEKARLKGYYDEYKVVGWCGRLDLAQKLLGKYSDYYIDHRILPVTAA